MGLRGGSWAKVVLVVVLVAVMAVPTTEASVHHSGHGVRDFSNTPLRPTTSGPGNVTWTLCLSRNQLQSGNAGCPSNSLLLFDW